VGCFAKSHHQYLPATDIKTCPRKTILSKLEDATICQKETVDGPTIYDGLASQPTPIETAVQI
jgi:hypothetical protein